MEYDVIIGKVTAGIFAWLFAVLTAKIKLTFMNKSFFYTFSVWLTMILSFTGLVLSLHDNRIAVAFSPYVLAGCALVYTSVDFYYFKQKAFVSLEDWKGIKSNLFKALAGALSIIAIVFISLGIKSDYEYSQEKTETNNKLDTLSQKVDKANSNIKDNKETIIKAKAERDKQYIELKSSLNNSSKEAIKDKKATKKTIKNLKNKTTSIKNDTEEIKQEMQKQPAPEKKEEKKEISRNILKINQTWLGSYVFFIYLCIRFKTLKMERNKKEFLDYLSKYGKDKSWNELAHQFNLGNGEIARGIHRRNKVQPTVNYSQVVDPSYVMPSVTITSSSTFTIDKETNTATIQSDDKLSTEDDILNYLKLDKALWEVKEIWTKEKQTKDLTHPLQVDGILSLYETTAKILPKTKEDSYKKSFQDFVNDYSEDLAFKVKPFVRKRLAPSPNVLIVSLTDLHFDKEANFEETEEHGGVDISSSRALTACMDLVDRASASHQLSKIIIIGGHDFFHGNTAANTTEKGTKLDVEGRWHQTFRKGLTLITTIIDYCKTECPVDYYNVIGNHGPERDQYLAIALEAFYRNDKNVTIESTYTYRKYFSFGRSAFMLTHEVGSKAKDLPVIFATERPEMFARSKYRYVLTGHFHKAHETQFVGTNENYGIMFKVCPSLSVADKWHHQNGYIGNQKSCLAMVINEDYGLIAELIYNE